VSVAYATVLETVVQPHAGSDAQQAVWVDGWRDKELAFNHAEILTDAERHLAEHRYLNASRSDAHVEL
jgi:hypothetical protein